MVTGIAVSILFNLNSWLIALVAMAILFIMIGWFFYHDMRKIVGASKLPRKFSARLAAYATASRQLRIERLLRILRKEQIRSKDTLKLTLDFFEQRYPIMTKTGPLEWILSVIVAVFSVVSVAYSDDLHMVDIVKLITVFWSTLQTVILIVVPIAILYFSATKIFFPHTKIDTFLVEDLAHIYINFDQYREQLET